MNGMNWQLNSKHEHFRNQYGRSTMTRIGATSPLNDQGARAKARLPFVTFLIWIGGTFGVPGTSLAAAPPVAAYNFNAGTGAVLTDQSGNSYSGTLTKGPAWTAGKYSGGMYFDGVDDFVSMGDVGQADDFSAFTVSVWAKFGVEGGGTNETQLVDKSRCDGATNGGPWELGVAMTRSHKAEVIIYPKNGTPAAYVFSGASRTSVDDGGWHFISGRYDGTNLSIWVDGVQEGFAYVPGITLANTTNALELGGHCGGYAYPFRGTLDDVRIYNRALTQAEMQADMATPIGGVSPLTDVTSPTAALTAPLQNATVVSVASIAANATDNVAVIGVRFLLDGATLGAEDLVAPHTLSWDTTLVANGTHRLSAVARDAAGNTATSAVVTVTVSNATIAPAAPSNLASGNITSSSIALSWSAPAGNVSVAGYRIFRDSVQVGTSVIPAVTDTGLAASTAYRYAVSAYDAAGNSSILSAPLIATTLAASAPDVTSPSIPTGLTATSVSASQVVLAWRPSTDNVGAVGYRVLRDGVQVGTATTTGFVNTALTPNNSYLYTVSAYDAAGNNSLASAALVVNTAASGGARYTTDFALTENPINESGRWTNGGSVGLDWLNIQTSGGRAYASATVSDAEGVVNDPIAVLTGTWSPNQEASATVYNTPDYPAEGAGINHEMELHLRSTITAHSIYTYECTVSSTGPFIVRWNGSRGNITYLTEVDLGFVPLATGQVIRATVVGDVISIYQDGRLISRATDSSAQKLTSGAPGLGFFPRSRSTLSSRAFTDFSGADL